MAEKYEVVARSNGHHWIVAFNLTCCRDCGIVRRADDKNKPCRGRVGIALRDGPSLSASQRSSDGK